MLFSNAGTAFPDLEDITRKAGGNAMEAGSLLWKVFSALETERELPDKKCLITASDMLSESSKIYFKVSQDLVNTVVTVPASDIYPGSDIYDDIEFGKWRGRFRGPFMRQIHWGEDFGISKCDVRVGALYEELAELCGYLAFQIDNVRPMREDDLREWIPNAFRMMSTWEEISRLGRIIAAVNSNKPNRLDQ